MAKLTQYHIPNNENVVLFSLKEGKYIEKMMRKPTFPAEASLPLKQRPKKKPRQKGDFCSFSLGGFEKAKACHINLGLVAENAQIYYFSYVIL